MKSFNRFINEGQEKKQVSREFIKGLLLNTHNTNARKFLQSMLSKDADSKTIEFSDKQHTMLNLIKTYGKIDPSHFGSKN